MRKVYKCDYCFETHEDIKYMTKHEATCYANPKNKDCGSCDNRADMDYSLDTRCVFGDEFESEKESPCSKWKGKQNE